MPSNATQRCPTCRQYRAALITYKGTRCTSCLVDWIKELEGAYERGRREERAAVVGYLDARLDQYDISENVIEDIECGEHAGEDQ